MEHLISSQRAVYVNKMATVCVRRLFHSEFKLRDINQCQKIFVHWFDSPAEIQDTQSQQKQKK